MSPQDEWKEQSPKREASFAEKVGWAAVGAAAGALAIWGLLTLGGPSPDDDDPDRPPIIVRNGSVIVEERVSPARGKWTKDPTKRTWYHEHAHKGPKRLNAFVVGVANNTCGSGGTNLVSNVKKAIFTYKLGNETRVIEILNRGNRVEIDVVSGPDPTVVNDWTLSFDAAGATLTEARFERPGGSDTCGLDSGAAITITQHK
jgi:hypothetical protein